MNYRTIFCTLFFSIVLSACQHKVPGDFCYIKEVAPGVIVEARYATNTNFIGRVVTGYSSEKLVMTRPAATALNKVQKELNKNGFGLIVFDAYRPQRAVNHFMRWCENEDDTLNKHIYYPNVAKKDLIPQGYIAAKSGHSRGSTIDLTVIELTTGNELDMGTPWDYFGPESHSDYKWLSDVQLQNRKLLRDAMIANGFKPLAEEWWHYTLVDEPFPDTYFDFVVE